MLVSDRTAFAKKPIGALVTLDKVFELVEGNLSNEKRTDIHRDQRALQERPGRTTAGRCGSPRRSACSNSFATCRAPKPTSPRCWSMKSARPSPLS